MAPAVATGQASAGYSRSCRGGDTACEEAVCSAAPECQSDSEVKTYTSTDKLAIPDNDPAGIASIIEIRDDGSIGAMTVSVDIAHSYRGDLRVTLSRGETEVVLHDQTGGYEDNLVETFTVESFDGMDMSGAFTMRVSDNASYDTGTLDGWSIELLRARRWAAAERALMLVRSAHGTTGWPVGAQDLVVAQK